MAHSLGWPIRWFNVVADILHPSAFTLRWLQHRDLPAAAHEPFRDAAPEIVEIEVALVGQRAPTHRVNIRR